VRVRVTRSGVRHSTLMAVRLPPWVLLCIAAAGWLACGGDDVSPDPSLLGGPGVPVHSRSGVVVSGSRLATSVGVNVLEQGGNAVDAAVATAFALAVVEPSMSGIGGRTQLVLRTADGVIAAIDGTTEVPVAYSGGPVDDESAYGWSTIAVPGTVAALAHALRAHGSWPLARIIEPAIRLAGDGFLLPEAEAVRIAGAAERLREFDGSRSAFLRPDGSAYGFGELLVQPDLATTLRAIAENGEDAFYRGPIAERMAEDIAAHGGLVTAADLTAYRAEESIVVRGSYRGHELVGSYLPASGATTIEILQILDHVDLSRVTGSADWISLVAQALLIGFEDREADVATPAEKAVWLTSRELAAERAGTLRLPPATALMSTRSRPMVDVAPAVVRRDRPLSLVHVQPGATDISEPAHTTHVSVADRWGGVVALTQSVGPVMGSKVTTPGLGFLYAATMGYLGELEPGTRRHWSSQSPLLVLRDGRPVLAIGGAGARRIISAVVETVSRFIDEGLPIDEALAAPRFHPTPSRIDVEVRPGAAWSEAELERLRTLGFTVRTRDDAPYFARVNVAGWNATASVWTGVADPRWAGAAAAFAR